ncbi:hypothetical protein H257_17512 [Aphanomyces astaci]|uniref:TPX2 C-terminal domain-containing protein n=1 Tax=Aphanomyces astaci TaxID=112090 RepID=W4FGI7_APHAT|nr:hypothetical protein H257_17512 [Aphanomyces astaci]ETV65873.1 hypothetical protein H257_17512 [Aphanomyces astaci]|eukprot:XP_009844626.1 hypothetical protein H257_17512 [Aphanomyces astaci]
MVEPEDDATTIVFDFDAPTYYDLNDGEFEKSYVNNADGYFDQMDNSATAALDAFVAAADGSHMSRRPSTKQPPTTATARHRRQTPPVILHDNNDDDNDDARSHTDSAPDSLNDDAHSRDDSTRSSSGAISSTSSRKPLTKPTAPTLHSAKRAEAVKQARNPLHHPQDADSIELQKKFHARPMPSTLDMAPNIAPNSSKPLTQPTMPKLATLARMGDKKWSSPPQANHPLLSQSTRPASVLPKQPPVQRSKTDASSSTSRTVTTSITSTTNQLERARAREMFEAKRKEAKEAKELAKRELEEQQRMELRRQQTYRAKPYTRPATAGFAVRPSTKLLTTPTSPKFHSTSNKRPTTISSNLS